MTGQDIVLTIWTVAIFVGLVLLLKEEERHKENMRKAEEKQRQEVLKMVESEKAYAETVKNVMAVLKEQNDEREKNGLPRLYDIGVRF